MQDISSSTKNANNISANERVSNKNQLCKPERGGQGRAIHALLNQMISDEGADIPLMSDLEKMSKEDLDEMSRLVCTLIDEKIAKTMTEKQVSLTFKCM